VKRHTPATVDRALSAYILCGNNSEQAHRLLVSYGDKPVPTGRCIRDWAEQHADRLHELREELHPQIAKKIASDAEALALKLAEAETLITERLLVAVEAGSLPDKELSGALRNVTTSKALQVDKLSSPLRGRPTVIHGNTDPAETLANLARKLGIPEPPQLPDSTASSS
jgi:crotonobetainyl-CoA:carnitine CoA-transferase CaiB-like acyl-CoA transferase